MSRRIVHVLPRCCRSRNSTGRCNGCQTSPVTQREVGIECSVSALVFSFLPKKHGKSFIMTRKCCKGSMGSVYAEIRKIGSQNGRPCICFLPRRRRPPCSCSRSVDWNENPSCLESVHTRFWSYLVQASRFLCLLGLSGMWRSCTDYSADSFLKQHFLIMVKS